MQKFLVVVVLASSVTACVSKPILLPNDKYNQTGHERSEQDIQKCETQADRQLKKTQGRRIRNGALKGLAMGALAGGIAGSQGHTGTLGGAAIVGAAGAGAGALGGSLETPEGARRELVRYCLHKKGYQVAGWE